MTRFLTHNTHQMSSVVSSTTCSWTDFENYFPSFFYFPKIPVSNSIALMLTLCLDRERFRSYGHDSQLNHRPKILYQTPYTISRMWLAMRNSIPGSANLTDYYTIPRLN